MRILARLNLVLCLRVRAGSSVSVASVDLLLLGDAAHLLFGQLTAGPSALHFAVARLGVWQEALIIMNSLAQFVMWQLQRTPRTNWEISKEFLTQCNGEVLLLWL